LFASPPLAARLRRKFPRSLDGEPFLLPIEESMLRRGLDHWFEAHGIRPRVVGEFQDLALAKAFGQAGKGVFATPSVVEDEVRRNYGVGVVGRTGEVVERYYAVSLERKFKHPAVLAVLETARGKLFAGPANPPHKDT
jgi:LysR family transcriptional activator of nhaA